MRIIERELLLKENGLVYLNDVFTKNYSDIKKISTPKDIFKVMTDVYYLDKKTEEHVYMIALNGKNKPISYFEISRGTINASLIDVRGILLKALYSNAINIILVHNHPSGNPKPSKEDIRCTDKLKKACELIEINLIDHIIIGQEKYFSFKESCIL